MEDLWQILPTILSSLVVAFTVFITNKVAARLKKSQTDTDLLKLSIQALLRSQIIDIYNRCKKLGYCELYEKDNLSNLYKYYHSLGLNGVMDGIYKDVMNLPDTPNTAVKKN